MQTAQNWRHMLVPRGPSKIVLRLLLNAVICIPLTSEVEKENTEGKWLIKVCLEQILLIQLLFYGNHTRQLVIFVNPVKNLRMLLSKFHCRHALAGAIDYGEGTRVLLTNVTYIILQLLYSFPLLINDISLLVSSGTNCLNLFHPTRILASTAASASPSTLSMSPQ